MDEETSGGRVLAGDGSNGPVAYPIDGWSNWVTFHDVCRECGRRITGFVCDSGRLTRLPGERWSVEMRWQHDGEGTIECDLASGARARWAGTPAAESDPPG
jgi:hypothetical protein